MAEQRALCDEYVQWKPPNHFRRQVQSTSSREAGATHHLATHFETYTKISSFAVLHHQHGTDVISERNEKVNFAPCVGS